MDVPDFVSLDVLEVDRLAFAEDERPVVAAHPVLSTFSNLTGSHVIGLLDALGEYAVRAGYRADRWKDAMPHVWRHPDATARHDELMRFWWTRCRSWGRLEEADGFAGDVLIELPDAGRQVFVPETSANLALSKYIKGLEHLTVGELCTLLGRVVHYSAIAQPMPVPGGALVEGPCRLVHAHNRIVSFAQRPFTSAEFGDSLAAALQAQNTAPAGNGAADGLRLAGLQSGVTLAAVERLRERIAPDEIPARSAVSQPDLFVQRQSGSTWRVVILLAVGAVSLAVTLVAWFLVWIAYPSSRRAFIYSTFLGLFAGVSLLSIADRRGWL